MSDRTWMRLVNAKLALGFALAAVAPYVVIIADRARVTRNARRWLR